MLCTHFPYLPELVWDLSSLPERSPAGDVQAEAGQGGAGPGQRGRLLPAVEAHAVRHLHHADVGLVRQRAKGRFKEKLLQLAVEGELMRMRVT